ncbi:dihydrofolate reductase [Bacteroidales bacterium OttesenSCG-928-K03]|nr:dihydrofolate reductase [Odoribacter sp. OttesenSCG-928-L07]MDL2240820.1 dihydrofolate reductase [Bacteroidales bacterium OttesenSCG-928-K22]MDL2242398.1 dihydrofolate reductase [Bacteroidales bacterium OttesenSCG-928-K03]
MISIVVAIAKGNNAIGFENRLLWSLPDDMKRFKELTTGHTVLMGRNTFLSLPKGALPNRRNIVITDNPDEKFAGCEMAFSIEEAVKIAGNDDEVFVMGGASIYRQFLPLADKLYLTFVDDSPQADTYFPEINFDEWKENIRSFHPADEKHVAAFEFLDLERKR